MTLHRPIAQITCPNCGAPIQASIEQLIDVGEDPAAKTRLLSGSLNRVRCPVCKYDGQLATPLVYHDPSKELLLTYVPVELAIPKEEQERALGRLINTAIERLPPEQRKAYLLQPQAVLRMQGLLERILEADGVTREEIEAQRERIQLFEELLRTPPESIPKFVEEHDDQLDETFFQTASISLQVTGNDQARMAATQLVEQALRASSFGKRLYAQEAEVRAASESLRAVGENLTREKLLELFIQAPNDDRIEALTSLTRPALDYAFFQLLTEKIDAQEGQEESQRLKRLRSRILEISTQIDRAQEARVAQVTALLKSLLEAEDLDQAVKDALPLVDDLFISILEANLLTSREKGDLARVSRLEEIDKKVRTLLVQSLPPELQLAQKLIEIEDRDEALALLNASPEAINDQLLGVLMQTAIQLENRGDKEAAERLRSLHKLALRIAMRAKMRSGRTGDQGQGDPSPSR